MPLIAPISDLHLEFFQNSGDGMPKINNNADIIVLAGDIANGINSLDFARGLAQKEAKPVVWVAGNHEYYKQDIKLLSAKFEKQSEQALLDGVYCVEYSDPVVLSGVRFSGCTMWTDCNLYLGVPRIKSQQDAAEIIGIYLNDFRVISNGDCGFSAMDSVNLHAIQYANLLKKITVPFDGKTVVVTHHGVHRESIALRYSPGERIINSKHKLPGENSNWMLNPGFASHLDELFEVADLCIHGHTHETIDYKDYKCRIMANPRGYPIGRLSDGRVAYENRNFNEEILVEV